MNAERVELAIVGAGCAGLSLAWHLLDAGIDGRRMVLIDPRTSYERDRTWCFFEVWPHPFEHLVTHRWERWRVRAPGGPWVERGDPEVPYAHLPADAFYGSVRARLAAAGVSLRLGVRAGAIDDDGRAARLETSAGLLEATLVFDSRPPLGDRSREVSLLQHFEGWEVLLEEDRFEPRSAILMDFDVPQTGRGAHFLYVLPFERRRALVEATWFSPDPPGDWTLHRESLRRYLGSARCSLVHRERGVIPMTTEPAATRWSPRIVPIGLAGGLAKPSTGYAFLDIQRHSAALAEDLAAGRPLAPGSRRSWLSHLQDDVFLEYLSRDPPAAAVAMVGLFERLAPDLTARFLHDRVSPRERVGVMRAMPIAAMTGALLRATPRWIRRKMPA